MKTIYTLFMMLFITAAAMAAGETVKYQVDGKTYEGYFVSPSPNAPFILMIHDWDGLTDYEKKRAHMLAEKGYAVFAADMFGMGVRPTGVKEKRKLTRGLYKDRMKMRSLLNGALQTAKNKGANVGNAVAMGYCFGGAVTLEFARTGVDLKGFVSFHGGLTIPAGQDYSNTKGKILVLHGSADKAVTMEQFANLTVELEKSGIDHEMITYSGAPHAFTVFGSSRYHEDADKKSWDRFDKFLTEVTN